MKRPGTIVEPQAAAIAISLPPQDALIWRIACETGLRIGDILRLRERDIDNPMTVHESKSKRARTVTLSDGLYQRLTRLVQGDDDALIFKGIHDPRKPYNRATHYRRLQRAAKGICRVSAHSARKLYAQRIYRATGRIQDVQEALHHRYLTTTATYLDIDLNDVLANLANIAIK